MMVLETGNTGRDRDMWRMFEAERKTFDTSHEGMQMGWTGTFNQLAQYLAKATAGGRR